MVRKLNEDSYVCLDESGLWAVADGMGGHQAGDLASALVTEKLGQVPACEDLGDLLFATRSAIAEANSSLVSMAEQFGTTRTPGSTVAALLIRGAKVAVVWAGDSRIYRLRNGEIQQITRDHSHVQELLDQHLISPEEANHHPMANVITRAVGAEDPLEVDVINLNFVEGDRFLLCSDGLSRLLSANELCLGLMIDPLENAVDTMLQIALERGASDNVTLILVGCEDKCPDDSETTRILPT